MDYEEIESEIKSKLMKVKGLNINGSEWTLCDYVSNIEHRTEEARVHFINKFYMDEEMCRKISETIGYDWKIETESEHLVLTIGLEEWINDLINIEIGKINAKYNVFIEYSWDFDIGGI